MKDEKLVDLGGFSKEMMKQFSRQKRLIHAPRARDLFRGKIEESAVLMLSDIHCGQVNKFLEPETGKMVTTYDIDKTIDEFDRLLDGVCTINQLLSANYQIDKLYIFGLGDYLEGDIIFEGQRFFISEGVGAQLVTLVGIMTNFINELLKTYKEIEFICISGNHGRFGRKREAAPTSNTFDYLMGKWLETVFKDEPRVKIVVPESWYYLAKIYNWRYLLHHGDTVYSWMSLPYYGLKRQGTARRIEIPHNMECIGHFHQKMEIPISSKSLTLVNGGWIEKSDFGWRKFGILSYPEQYYFGVSPKRSRSWCFGIDLLHQKHELKDLGGK